jgi:Tol biopolymer transport system component
VPRRRLAIALSVVSVFSLALAASPQALAATTERVSVDSTGNPGDGDSKDASISADGRFVAFRSDASNLVAGDTNAAADIFVRDRQTGTTQRVSVDSAGNQGNGDSKNAWISADGRFVAFRSFASNLVSGDTNGVPDIFVHDLQTGTTERVSVDASGHEANGASGEAGPGISDGPSISADGRFVAFRSSASNLVPGDGNGKDDIFVHDRQTGATERVSVDSAGNEGNGYSYGPSLSADGRFVAFRSNASNLVPGDTNGTGDDFVYDRQTDTTERVSVDGSGNQGNGESIRPEISADGRFVAFRSFASNLVPGDTNGFPDIFVHDRQTGATERVSVDSAGNQGSGDNFHSSISANGRFVAFRSDAANLVPGDSNGVPDVFVHDRQTGATERVSVDSAGNEGNGLSQNEAGSISADGRFVVFQSDSSNLVAGDTNASMDVFLRDRGSPPAVPTFTGTNPASPGNNNSPRILGSAATGSTVKLYPTSDCSGSPAATGSAADFASPGLQVAVADNSATTFHATATDSSGNVSACSSDSITYVEDSAPPSGAQITSALPTFGLATPFTVAWGGATDSRSGVKSYDAYVRSAPYNGAFTSTSPLKTSSGPDSASFAGQPGNTYCFSVTATDNAGNTSGPSAEKCTALPVDDAALAGSGWTRATGQTGYYQGTSSTSFAKGATLSLAGVQAKRLALVATTCRNCGKVQVLLGGTAIGTVNLASRNTQTEQVLSVASFSAVQTGTVTLKVTTAGKPVIIDGLGVSRN